VPGGLISLKGAMDEVGEREALFRLAQQTYCAALSSVETTIFQALARKVGDAALSLAPERARLERRPDAEAFAHARKRMEAALQDAAEQITRQMAGTVELGEVLSLLSDTSAHLNRQGDRSESQLREVASELSEASRLSDVAEFRSRVQSHVRDLTGVIERMRSENREILFELEREMGQYRKKLDEAQRLVCRDELTGLPNRRSFQDAAAEYVRSGVDFCVMIADIDRFKAINERFGHASGDELLRAFGRRLQNRLLPEERAARWGGDQFVVILPAKLPEAMTRARDLDQAMRGEYALGSARQMVHVRISLTFCLADRKQGESAGQLMARADSLLHTVKRSA
jgi:diguanylate cyclase